MRPHVAWLVGGWDKNYNIDIFGHKYLRILQKKNYSQTNNIHSV